jgi:hypothetical protein
MFVVPPIAWRTRHDYLRWSKKLRSESIAWPQDALNVLLCCSWFFVVYDRLMD